MRVRVRIRHRAAALLVGAGLSAPALAPTPLAAEVYAPLGAPADPRVPMAWNRFHDTESIGDLLRRFHEAHPGLAELVDLGRSYEGRPILGIVVTDESTGPAESKPAMYIDGNIHGNEVQTSEVVLYTAWYLLESHGRVERITNLLRDRAFYLVPTINPDGRDHWFESPANPHLSRGGRIPVDEDGDGLYDEDGPDDLDGDGEITAMRIRDPWGRHEPDPDFPEELLQSVERDERGDYRLLGWEGYDNDGDGAVNEDGPGGYDPNRNWPWQWQPESIQPGAMDYPFSLPSTRAVGDFVKSRPNIAAAQSYHNAGGMILRGPGQEGGPVARADDEILQFIGKRGEEMIPFYNSWVVWKDLYTVWGGEFEWFYGGLGVLAFTNELWTNENYLRRQLPDGQDGDRAEAAFRRDLLFDAGWTPWKEVAHPDYGTVEIGGTARTFGRVPPSFLLEEELHRNMAFTLYHAECMPRVSIAGVETESMAGGLWRVRVTVENQGVIPTRTAHDVERGITPRNVVVLDGLRVVAGGVRTDPHRDAVQWQEVRPGRVFINTIPGLARVVVEFVVAGAGNAELRVETSKGGTATSRIRVG